MSSPIRTLDVENLRRLYHSAEPFPYFAIDDFLEEDFAREVFEAYPSYEDALAIGREFSSVNEKLKVQICNAEKFARPIARLNEAISAPGFLRDLTAITEIPNLLADPQLRGGGMHLTNTTGRLDVHVDFNYIEEHQLHRRLNILIYFNPGWEESWGGRIELWEQDARECRQSFSPTLNRCVIFETTDISFHGVTPVTCPTNEFRRSFAAYYYTREPPTGWTGGSHSTIFMARPDEVLRGKVLMPAEQMRNRIVASARSLKRRLRGTIQPRPDQSRDSS